MRLRRDDDKGFGMAEALVSMLLLAVIAAAFLPLLATSLKAATVNTTVTTATQAVNEQLSTISTREFLCSEISHWLTAGTITHSDPRGVKTYLHRTAGAGWPTCSTGGTVTLTVSATDTPVLGSPETTVLTSASTIVRVKGP
ncbi:hypothetical protein [Microbacterium sp. NPDC096154]|uniref:hypothetical protein n=1 Tax=Microbacterium sp. NPDC096154 TaxID=3155549 RepID=UPI003330FD08